jgi:ABC-type amino acid transport system permease subunit
LITAAVFYWVMTLVFSYFQNRLEGRLSRGER